MHHVPSIVGMGMTALNAMPTVTKATCDVLWIACEKALSLRMSLLSPNSVCGWRK